MYSADYVWGKVISCLEDRLGAVTVAAYLDDARVIELSEEQLILYSPTEFRRKVIRDSFLPSIREVLREQFQSDAEVEVYGDAELENRQGTRREPVFVPMFTFDRFVTGPSNSLACKAAMAVAQTPGQMFNPLYLCGPSGVGKTHLLYSIAAELRERKPDAKIVILKGEEFVNELITALIRKKNEEFRNKYRYCDLFLIDDIHFLAGKEATQEEFFNTFNALYEAGKQIVVTSDRRPNELLTLESRLRSRFEGGLIAEIRVPDYETRRQILKAKAKQLKLTLPDEICDFIAGNVTESVRQLEGILKTLLACRNLEGMPFDLAHVAPLVSVIAPAAGTAVPEAAQILGAVCRYYSVSESDLRSQNRKRRISAARDTAVYLLRDLRKMSFQEIGSLLDRHYSSVMHSFKNVEEALQMKNEELQKQLGEIRLNIENA